MATISKEINHSNIFEKISDFLKFNDAFEISSTLFNCLESDAERVFLVYSILNSSLLLPDIKIKEEKLESKAEHWRKEGNAAFMKKQDINAIKWYTQSIGYAIPENKEMSLALANRSAVTFALGEYSQSIRDIDAALNGKYPDNLKYKLYERKGKCFQKLNLEASAKKYFEIAAKWISNSSLNESKQESIRRNIEREISNCTNKDYPLEKKDSIIPNVSHPNPEILSASSSIKIEYDACIGRHLRATQDILPGDVLVVEQPYASILLPNDYLLYCNHCLMRCHCMIPCATCTLQLGQI
uniref:SET domain-containing protein n=1 Tax=Clastoptera arizonana TaxID=38151 RepID=A0A1B6BZN3_9HEMI